MSGKDFCSRTLNRVSSAWQQGVKVKNELPSTTLVPRSEDVAGKWSVLWLTHNIHTNRSLVGKREFFYLSVQPILGHLDAHLNTSCENVSLLSDNFLKNRPDRRDLNLLEAKYLSHILKQRKLLSQSSYSRSRIGVLDLPTCRNMISHISIICYWINKSIYSTTYIMTTDYRPHWLYPLERFGWRILIAQARIPLPRGPMKTIEIQTNVRSACVCEIPNQWD